MSQKTPKYKEIVSQSHDDRRPNIPTQELQSVVPDEIAKPIMVAYQRRNPDLDPQLVWRGKHMQGDDRLEIPAPPLYIQEKIHPKVLVDDLRNLSEQQQAHQQLDMFGDFNGIPEGADKTEFYQHDQNWTNRMILGDSMQVMASLAEREGLRGKVQCIYFDPPYGIKFNSNFQWSTTNRDVKDGKADHITREPEQVKAFRDTWRDGIHSYLSYLRDRLIVARDLLTESGSIFVQIGDENVHRVRAIMDEVFGDDNFISQITFVKTGGLSQDHINNKCDYILWFSKNKKITKSRSIYDNKPIGEESNSKYTSIELPNGIRLPLKQALSSFDNNTSYEFKTFRLDKTTSESNPIVEIIFRNNLIKGSWKTTTTGMSILEKANRISPSKNILNYVRYIEDFPVQALSNVWDDIGGIQSRVDPKIYVVQTATEAIKRCILMTTDPGDLVLDPTCGSGTSAFVAEQWGRRWITIDTSRVALALARGRLMGARYSYYLLKDTREGQIKEAELSRRAEPSSQPTYGNIRQGFVYERVPHITLGSIANNSEIDIIWEKFEAELEPLREQLSAALPAQWLAKYRKTQKYDLEPPASIQEWEIPRELPSDWSPTAQALHARFWELRIARQREIDASIAAKAEYEYLYDKPYEDKTKVRVAGPFTVESLAPHRTMIVDADDELIDQVKEVRESYGQSFEQLIFENLKTAGIQQSHKADRIDFSSLDYWPGEYISAEGRYNEGTTVRRAAIMVGPEFGTIQRSDLIRAAREAGDAGFDVLISCAFSFSGDCADLQKLGRIQILRVNMNADLHMAGELKETKSANLFVIFGEPDIEISRTADQQIQVEIKGVDVFDPSKGEVRSDDIDGIACWFIDTDYNEESFFVRHAYFLGANNDPYKALKSTLKAEINENAWQSLYSNISRPFPKPQTGRIAVKVINHLGDEVMKVYRV
jgi:adenine-specific DNA-methyltransferase